MKMTFNEYDQKCENIKRIENTKTGWYPSDERNKLIITSKEL